MTNAAASVSVEPLGVLATPCDVSDLSSVAHGLRLEFSSRGDRVVCRVALPASTTKPPPVVLLLADAGGSCDSTSFPCLGALLDRGIAIATLDLSLHGPRKSPKFSERLVAALAGKAPLDENARALADEFAAQSESDITRCIDVLAARREFDASDLGLLGVGVGASLAGRVAAHHRRAGPIALYSRGQAPVASLDADAAVASLSPDRVLEAARAPDDDTCAFFAMAFARD